MGTSKPSGASPKVPRVLLYARTSTVRIKSPAMQLEALRGLAEQRGWNIVAEYVDAGQSGAKDCRPQLDALMRHVHRGGVDVVAVWRFDRFARLVRHLVTALEDFRARGLDFVSMQDAIDTSTPTGRFTFAVIRGRRGTRARDYPRENARGTRVGPSARSADWTTAGSGRC